MGVNSSQNGKGSVVRDTRTTEMPQFTGPDEGFIVPAIEYIAQALCMADCAKRGFSACTWAGFQCQDYQAAIYIEAAERAVEAKVAPSSTDSAETTGRMSLRDAARDLAKTRPYKGNSMIGINEPDGHIRAYLFGNDWRIHDLPLQWHGWPVIWSKGHGRPTAA